MVDTFQDFEQDLANNGGKSYTIYDYLQKEVKFRKNYQQFSLVMLMVFYQEPIRNTCFFL